MIEYDGMRYPSINRLIDEMQKTSKDAEGHLVPMPSKYRLVVAVAKRARTINSTGQCYLQHPSGKKAIGVALEEVAERKIGIDDIAQ